MAGPYKENNLYNLSICNRTLTNNKRPFSSVAQTNLINKRRGGEKKYCQLLRQSHLLIRIALHNRKIIRHSVLAVTCLLHPLDKGSWQEQTPRRHIHRLNQGGAAFVLFRFATRAEIYRRKINLKPEGRNIVVLKSEWGASVLCGD